MDIEYGFGIGDGHRTVWSSPADLDLSGDGIFDAVALDFTGDGLIVDAMWDSDGDGVADTVRLNVVGDGPEQWYTDEAADGTWSTRIDPDDHGAWNRPDAAADTDPGCPAAAPHDPVAEPAPALPDPPTDTAPPAEPDPPVDPGPPIEPPPAAPIVDVDDTGAPVLWVDTTGDGRVDTRLRDSDGDGLLDASEPVSGDDPSIPEPPDSPGPDAGEH